MKSVRSCWLKSLARPFMCIPNAIMRAYRAYTNAFAFIDYRIHYAVKANSNLAVLGVFSEAGAGFDIVSSGELARVLAVDADPSSIVYSGVGNPKTT